MLKILNESIASNIQAPVNAAGSPLPGEPAFLAVGKLRHAHGVHGEILMEVYTDFPERLQPGASSVPRSGSRSAEVDEVPPARVKGC